MRYLQHGANQCNFPPNGNSDRKSTLTHTLLCKTHTQKPKMSRLIPLPERSVETKPTERRGTAAQKELDDLKSQLQELQDVQLESQKSQLIAAQERLKLRRKSELAKRMQETQRLQLLKEQRAELDDERRSKVSGFKQRMIAAAERQLSRESNIYDALYENIGEALLEGEDDESTVYEEEHGAIEFHPRSTMTMDPLPPIIERPAYLDSIRVKSAFEEQLGATQAKFTQQRRALQSVHATYPSTNASQQRTSIVISSEALHRHEIAQDKPTKNSLLADFLNSDYGKESPATVTAAQEKSMNAGGNGNSNDYCGLGSARDEHRKLREELWRLLSQAGEDPSKEMPPEHQPLQPTEISSNKEGGPAAVDEMLIVSRAQELDDRDAMQSVHNDYVSASAVVFEDELHRGVAIQNDAEENIRQQRALDRKHRPSQLAPIRSHSLVLVTEDSMHTIPSTKKKDRRVSMLVEGDAPPEGTPAEEPITLFVGRQRAKRDAQVTPLTGQQQHDAEQLRIEQEQARYFAKRAQRSSELRALQQTLESLEQNIQKSSEKPVIVRRKLQPIERVSESKQAALQPLIVHEEVATEAALPTTPDEEEELTVAHVCLDLNLASRKIQCRYRQYQARVEVAIRRQRYHEQLEEKVELTLLCEREQLLELEIEARHCATQLEAEQEKLRALDFNEQFLAEASELQALLACEKSLTRSRVTRCQQDVAATRVQCAVRQWIARRAVQLRRVSRAPQCTQGAACKLQNWWRYFSWKKGNTPHPRLTLMRRYGPSVECGGFFDVAAIAIQCMIRRRFARCRVAELYRNRQTERNLQNKNDASCLIQEAWRIREVRQAPTRNFVNSLICDSMLHAAVLRETNCDCRHVCASDAIDAATRIGRTVKGMLVRRQLHQRWVSALVDRACDTGLYSQREK